MSVTRGGPNKRVHFTWHYDPATARLLITAETDKRHTYPLRETQAILRGLYARFGTAILEQMPGDTYHAQGASYLGVVLEEAGYLQWNNRHRGIAWRLTDADFSADTLIHRLGEVSHTDI